MFNHCSSLSSSLSSFEISVRWALKLFFIHILNLTKTYYDQHDFIKVSLDLYSLYYIIALYLYYFLWPMFESITCDLQTILDLQKVTFALTLMRI
ncbi:hypothetical protein JHK86_028479 [Glycine max]|nr:hypothetical protein JHK86_028479 [Glycine max]